VSRAAERINEAARLGFRRVIAPLSNADQAPQIPGGACTGIAHVKDLASSIWG